MVIRTETNSILTGITPKRGIIYARVSTDEQAETGTSINNQVEKSLAYARANNMQVVGIFREDFTGTKLDRPELNKVRQMLHAGDADALIAYKPNRLDRSEWGVNLLIMLKELKTLGVELHYSEAGREIDLNNPTEALMQSIWGWQAGEDRRETVKKLTDGKISRVKEGYVVTARPPFGYDIIKNGRKATFVVNEKESATVRLIFKLYAKDGLSLYGVARQLTEMKLKTPADYGKSIDKSRRKRGFGEWGRSSISKILNNPVYNGEWQYGTTKRIDGKLTMRKNGPIAAVSVPAIVDQDIWLAAQERLDHNRNHRPPNRNYLLSGVIKCRCDSPMGGETSHGRSYYRCTSRTTVSGACGMGMVLSRKVDELVWNRLTEWVGQFADDPVKAKGVLKAYQQETRDEVSPLQTDLDTIESLIEQERREWEASMENLRLVTSKRAKSTLALEIDRTEKTLDELEKRRQQVIAKIEQDSLTDDQIETVAELLVQLAADWEVISTSIEDQQAALRFLHSQVKVCYENKELTVDYDGRLQAGPKTLRGSSTTSTGCGRQPRPPPERA